MLLRSRIIISVLLCAVPAGAEPAAQSVALGDLPHAVPADAEPFHLGATGGQVRVWGRGVEVPRVYFDEFLPALFERTCVFDELSLSDAAFEWIFTGRQGGITVRVEAGRVVLLQRFYDSFGFNPAEGEEGKPGRHPETIRQQSSVLYTGRLKAVAVRLDHRLGLEVDLNGKPAMKQQCLLDLSRHQLRAAGNTGNAKGRMFAPSTRETALQLDLDKRHQTIIGFGGITAPTAYAQLSLEGKRRWWQLVCEYNLRIQREYPNGQRLNAAMDNWDRLADATPHYYGDNFPNGEISDFAYIRTLRRLGGLVFFEFWDLPAWVASSDTEKDQRASLDLDAYARAIVGYCRASCEKSGAPPDIAGIQNEKHQSVETWCEMAWTLRRELDRAGFGDVKIHMPDAGALGDGIKRLRAIQEHPGVYTLIDFNATHMYDYQSFFTNPDGYDAQLIEYAKLAGGKPFLSTELCINWPQYQMDSYRLALQMGQLYHKNLTLTDAAAICYCWTLLNVVQPSYGSTRSLMVPDTSSGFVPVASSHQLRVFGSYSRRLPRGMVRIDTSSSSPDVLAAGFVGPDGAFTVILLNRDVATHEVTIHGSPLFSVVERTDPYHENTPGPVPPTDENGDLKITVPPGSVATLSSVPLGWLQKDFTID